MRTRRLAALLLPLVLALSGIVVLAGSRAARAQQPGTTTPVPPPLTVAPPTPVRLDRMDVAVAIDDQLAATSVDLTFLNATDRPQEAVLLFPLPPGAAVTDFSMTVDGRTLEGELLGREEAARIYTDIVRTLRDPALLEYVGLNVVRARVFPVPAQGQSRLTLRFNQFLPLENGTLRYRLPLSVGADTGPTVSHLSISARVTNSRGVGSLFSPTQAMKFERRDAAAMTASFEAANLPLRGSFELDVLPAGETVPTGLIAYRTPGQDGFFMLWLAPPLRQEEVVDKDVILVLDTSGSMAGVKIEQAKAALRYVLARLNPGDRFTVVDFAAGVRSFGTQPGLHPVSEVDAALAYVDRLRAEGGTNINDALLTGLRLVEPERQATLIFLTDGLPTVGEQRRERILENVSAAAPPNARLFVFGVGNDVDTVLLDALAIQNRGDVAYVEPREDIEEKVATLYNRIGSPQLTDVRLDMGGAAYDIYPQPLPDLFGGQTLYVFGRYQRPGPVSVTLSGRTRDGLQTYSFDGLTLAESDSTAPYLPYLWAGRKVTALLRQIRLQGPENSREQIDEVVLLATRYGIVTPYTSFIVTEPGGVSRTDAAREVARQAGAPSTGAAATGAAAQTGAVAAATPAPRPAATPRPATPAATTVPLPPGAPPRPATPTPAPVLEQRFAGDKSFVLRNGVWVDTAYQPGTETVKVAFGSDEYFALLVRIPALAPYFAVGERVIVVYQGTAYEVTA